jgi:hypothetical protein
MELLTLEIHRTANLQTIYNSYFRVLIKFILLIGEGNHIT